MYSGDHASDAATTDVFDDVNVANDEVDKLRQRGDVCRRKLSLGASADGQLRPGVVLGRPEFDAVAAEGRHLLEAQVHDVPAG